MTADDFSLERSTAESDFDFAASFAVDKLVQLPGNTEEPTNNEWQKSVVRGLEFTVRFIRTSGRLDLMSGLETHLRLNATRIQELGATTTAASLHTLAEQLADTQTATTPPSPGAESAA